MAKKNASSLVIGGLSVCLVACVLSFTIGVQSSTLAAVGDDFNDNSRNTSLWDINVLSRPLQDPAIVVAEQNQELEIDMGASIHGHNGYVTVPAADLRGRRASIELIQVENIQGVESIFAVGIDRPNRYEFSVAGFTGNLFFEAHETSGPGAAGSVPLDLVQHRFLGLRCDFSTNEMVWETSPDGVVWTEQMRYTLTNSAAALKVEIGAGKFIDTPGPATAIFDNFLLETLQAPTAAPAAVSGNMTTSDGRLLGGVTVTLSGGPQARRTITNSSGHYSFQNVETGDFYTVSPMLANYVFTPVQRSFSLSGNKTDAVFTGTPTAETSNPLDTPEFFVRQNYLDLLNREPDEAGFNFWTDEIASCGSDQSCLSKRRVQVSNAFFFEPEYQQTGAYVFRLYRAAYGNNQPLSNPDKSNETEARKLPAYAAFQRDRSVVSSGANMERSQLDLANAFVRQPEFNTRYPDSLDGPSFVTALLNTIKNDSGANLQDQYDLLLRVFNEGGRGAVLYRLADDNAQSNPINNRAFIDAEYRRAFVAALYFGYLKRDPDIGGLLFWLDQVNRFPARSTRVQNAMVCSFVTSREYQLRHSSVITHSDAECAQ